MADFRCFLVEKDEAGEVRGGVARRPAEQLPEGDVLVRVAYSSLNYKDALAASGHPGVVKQFPHIPGIDAAGTVEESGDPRYEPGDEVIVTSYELGAGRWGGWAERIRVPGEWVIPLPSALSLREAMIYGTAGLTAAIGVGILERHDVTPAKGDVVVTGATGGVGTLAVMLLAKLGYSVSAVTGKADQRERLRRLGAARTLPREEVDQDPQRPLLSSRWAGAIDTVGGNTLATLIRQCQGGGCVAACGLVGGTDLPLTVHPFILRGVTLAGIDTAWRPREQRLQIWQKLAGDWKPDGLESIVSQAALDSVQEKVNEILAGKISGRVVVEVA